MADLRQRRSARACHECNRKKTKCDMQSPVCGLCQRTRKNCQFPTKRRAPSIQKAQGKSNSQKLNENLGKLLRLLDAGSHHELLARRASSIGCQDQGTPASSSDINQSDSRQTRPNCPRQQNLPSAEIEYEETNEWLEQICVSLQVEESSIQSPNHAPHHPQVLSRPEYGQSLGKSLHDEVSYELAIHLINMFFDWIQPWLPLLHQPSFLTRYMNQLEYGQNSMISLAVEEKLLLSCMFALSARYSDSVEFAGIQPSLRGNRFQEMARKLYNKARDLQSASFIYLQGCVLLSFCYYTSGFSARGWIVVGVCVRLAYELDLSDIDDDYESDKNSDDCNQTSAGLAVIQQEERRRAWWLVWELDTFGSSVSKRPYAIDRRRMKVMLPISDESWFSGTATQSSKMDTRLGESWKSLKDSENCDARDGSLLQTI